MPWVFALRWCTKESSRTPGVEGKPGSGGAAAGEPSSRGSLRLERLAADPEAAAGHGAGTVVCGVAADILGLGLTAACLRACVAQRVELLRLGAPSVLDRGVVDAGGAAAGLTFSADDADHGVDAAGEAAADGAGKLAAGVRGHLLPGRPRQHPRNAGNAGHDLAHLHVEQLVGGARGEGHSDAAQEGSHVGGHRLFALPDQGELVAEVVVAGELEVR
mmetsp:Transcript_59515/g.177087  ORF Transcript_59515/g.177087 Transcript_59515/m.177087 type:complete len:218 (+) Transcript_59515:37-690(+)